MSSSEGDAAGPDPAAAPGDDHLDDDLLEAAAAAEGGFEGPSGGDDIVDVAALVAERDEYRDTLLRLKAEFDNFKKRSARESGEVRERAAQALVEKLLVVLDACDAAIGHGAPDVEPIAKMLLEVLGRDGLEKMEPEGQAFDPNHHEAVLHEPGDGSDGGEVVVDVLRTGYLLKGRVLRPAMVKVRG